MLARSLAPTFPQQPVSRRLDTSTIPSSRAVPCRSTSRPMKSATTHNTGVAPTVHDSVRPPATYPTRIRKTKRRAMPTPGAPLRGRTRSSEQRDRSARPTLPNPSDQTSQHNRSDPSTISPPNSSAPPSANTDPHPAKPTPDAQPPHPHPAKRRKQSHSPPLPNPPTSKTDAWTYEELHAVAQEVMSRKTVDVTKLFGGSDATLPQPLIRKTHAHIKSVIDSIKGAFDNSLVPFAPKFGINELLAALSSELYFLKEHKKERDQALALLAKNRAERVKMEKTRDKLLSDIKAISDQIAVERTRRNLVIQTKADKEQELEAAKRKVEEERNMHGSKQDKLEKAKLDELDMRRRLNRMRLKVAALRGEMVTATVDELSRPPPKWLAEVDESVTSAESDPNNAVKKEDSADGKKQSMKNELDTDGDIVPAENVEAGNAAVGKGDDLELNEDAEDMELRLLKNRLAMCETEAQEWRDCVESERAAVQLLKKARSRLDEELMRQKHPGSGKSGGVSGRGIGKSVANVGRNANRLRPTGRASAAGVGDQSGRKVNKRGRKGKAYRGLIVAAK